MLKHTQKIREMYEKIQKQIFYMIPEKWDKLYLYASIVDRFGMVQTGELFFYYIPRGILKRKPVNVYEIPFKFNIDEEEYMKLVDILYELIKEIRNEFKESGCKVWNDLTICIDWTKFRIEFNYDELPSKEYNNDERHIIWKYKYLKQGIESYNKEERKVIKKFIENPNILVANEIYESGIYVKDVKNIVDYETSRSENKNSKEYLLNDVNNNQTYQINNKRLQ